MTKPSLITPAGIIMNCRGRLRSFDRPLVMGIINATPDSFFGESRAGTVESALALAGKMLEEGADILDIGGQSTRPGSSPLIAREESARVLPVIGAIADRYPDAWISVDTWHADVARLAVEAGAGMINDIGGGNLDPEMIPTVAALRVPYVCMHMKGEPATMQAHARYEDVTREVLDFFVSKSAECTQAGINDLVLDPGFGFAKTVEHNFTLLRNLRALTIVGKPLMVGLSRKSSIWKTLGQDSPAEALNGTTVLNTVALLNGAGLLRVHDVKEAREAVTLVQRLFA